MVGLLRFIGVSLVVGVMVIGMSVGWQKFTSRVRPQPLESVYSLVKDTALGQKAADTLGVSTDNTSEPITIDRIIGSIVNTAKEQVEKRAHLIIVRQAVLQLMNQYEKLQPEEKTYIQELLCQPEATSSAAGQNILR